MCFCSIEYVAIGLTWNTLDRQSVVCLRSSIQQHTRGPAAEQGENYFASFDSFFMNADFCILGILGLKSQIIQPGENKPNGHSCEWACPWRGPKKPRFSKDCHRDHQLIPPTQYTLLVRFPGLNMGMQTSLTSFSHRSVGQRLQLHPKQLCRIRHRRYWLLTRPIKLWLIMTALQQYLKDVDSLCKIEDVISR